MKQSELFHKPNCSSLPVCLDNVEHCNAIFPFFVLVQLIISFYIFAAQHHAAIAAVYISNCVPAGDELPVLFRPLNHIYSMSEQKGSSATSSLTKQSTQLSELRICMIHQSSISSKAYIYHKDCFQAVHDLYAYQDLYAKHSEHFISWINWLFVIVTHHTKLLSRTLLICCALTLRTSTKLLTYKFLIY